LNEANPESEEGETKAEGNKSTGENEVASNQTKEARKEVFKRIHRE
jgi:hypothetical protein